MQGGANLRLAIYHGPKTGHYSTVVGQYNLYDAGCQQLARAVQQLDQGADLQAQPQQGDAGYYSFPSEQQLAEFAALGYQLFASAEI